jgi:protoporphyrinogen oxidase
MKIAVIGAGFCGLTAAYRLCQKGHQVVVFEKEPQAGGLASSFEIYKGIQIERFIHHIFQSDNLIISLAKEIGLSEKLIFRKSKDGIFYNGKTYPFASGFDLLSFSPLPLFDRLRFGLVTLYLKGTKNWEKFEDKKAADWIKKRFGTRSFSVVWGPLLKSKFGHFADQISMAWFWARVHSRTPKLGYFEGGFSTLANTLVRRIEDSQGKIKFSTPVITIESQEGRLVVRTSKENFVFDKVITTVPASIFIKIVKGLDKNYRKKIEEKDFLAATNLLLVLKKSLIPFYWLNINDANFPFVIAAEHTNFMPKSWYQGKVILNLGSYVEATDKRFNLSKDEAVKYYLPYLRKVNPEFGESWIEKSFFFRALYAQPVVDCNYATSLPGFQTPVKNLYLATMAQVYPWDRGTNYAVKLGEDIAEIVLQKI